MFDEIPHSEKVLKRHQNSDDPCIMAWDHYKRDQAPKQQSKKHVQKAMQKQSKGIGRYTRNITGTLIHPEDSDFRINN